MDTGFPQDFPGRDGADGVNASFQFTVLQHVLIHADILSGRHIGNARHAHFGRILSGGASGEMLLVETFLRDDSLD